jgi:hypothetical protein
VWGNFNVGYVGNELAHVDRGLYGANLHFGSGAITSFWRATIPLDGFRRRTRNDGELMRSFVERAGRLLPAHQDILRGSERVRIELRDKDSGIVTGVVNLRYGLDYDIDYLQGRLLLSEPLSSTAEDNLLVRSSGLSGNEANLVARYEYTPGFDRLDAVAMAARATYWLNDHVRFGLTGNANEQGTPTATLAPQTDLRKSTDSCSSADAAERGSPLQLACGPMMRIRVPRP